MIYCPNCKKPSAKATGQCPHCGAALGSAPAKPMGSNALPVDAAHAPTQAMDFGAEPMDLDLGDDDDVLELAITDSLPAPPAPGSRPGSTSPAAQLHGQDASADTAISLQQDQSGTRLPATEISSMEVAQIAGFGDVGQGLVATLTYGWRVFRRLPQLRNEKKMAQNAKDEQWAKLEGQKATLGRVAVRNGVADESIEKLVTRAKKVDERLGRLSGETHKLELTHQKQMETIDRAMATTNAEAEPIRAEELRAQSALDQVTTNKKRTTAKIKRSEIELRNIKEQIEIRQAAYADQNKPKEERQRLLAEISKFDNQRKPILDRLAAEQQELTSLDEPHKQIQATLGEVRERLAQKNKILAGLAKQKKELTAEFEQAAKELGAKAKNEKAQSDEAWAAVGEKVFVLKLSDHPNVTNVMDQVAAQSQQFFDAQRQLSLYEQAVISYDHEAYAKAGKLALFMGALLILLLVLVGIFAG